jgi:hypothetical protein
MAEAGSDLSLPDGDPSRVLGLDSGCGLRALHSPTPSPSQGGIGGIGAVGVVAEMIEDILAGILPR